MRPLRADDPRSIGQYRTLTRLGAGGMGVVYLARSPGGALAAVKVIRAEHAADPGFRARFRREVAAAGRIEGPWTVRLTGADPDAAEPWLATEYVAGPSLAEAVNTFGALPLTTVRVLGTRLAQALEAVHAAGLVHRDVKPGNILLALDGPRLIDFGIARASGATALTATGAMIGTPGYLSPEQATASGPEAGPPSDVFSLGCVLAYAASGRRPFGEGTPSAVVFRTVHEEPDLAAVPRPLFRLVSACLAKDPVARPTPEAVQQWLAAPDTDEWLPQGLPALIAERSAQVLSLPDPEPLTQLAPTTRPTRRRLLVAGTAGAVLAAGGGTAAWLNARRSPNTPNGSTVGNRPTYTIAVHADLSGPGKATGQAHDRGARIAVAEHNARESAPFRLAVRTEDDAGDPARAAQVANRLVADPKVLAVIGPTTEATVEKALVPYTKARLVTLVISPSSNKLSTVENENLSLVRPSDSFYASVAIRYLTRVRPSNRTAVIRDDEGGQTAWEMAKDLSQSSPSSGTTTVYRVAQDSEDFTTPAKAAKASGQLAVVYGGTSPRRAALCAKALAAAGFTGERVAGAAAMDPAFFAEAGPAAEGWVLAAAFVDPEAEKRTAAFTRAHRKRYGAVPGRWAAEAYDAVGLLAKAVESTSAGDRGRSGVARRLFLVTHRGVSRNLSFAPNTHLVDSTSGLFLYRVEGGRPKYLGPYMEVPQDRG
ncbi:bifunctional serine/threonine-protein kinase/ABC transporter substrate-binding protein [Streptomyces sp. NPDC050504]|uniref:bifunctional serine/threonine-protein kinase/ABC transporter substrate-binding protein n=1 Tax=Streptomyces sp. NPDC050504 TaxID=3365618 RepID=UPI0037AD02A5